MRHSPLIHTTHSPHETRRMGEAIGGLLKGGEVLCLTGPLGAGKTCFIQGIGQGLEVPDHVINSPTFTIHHEYAGRLTLHHWDFYRMDRAEEIEELGLCELFDNPGSTLVIEWAEKARDLLPENQLKIRIETNPGDTRKFEITAVGESYDRLLDHLKIHPHLVNP